MSVVFVLLFQFGANLFKTESILVPI